MTTTPLHSTPLHHSPTKQQLGSQSHYVDHSQEQAREPLGLLVFRQRDQQLAAAAYK